MYTSKPYTHITDYDFKPEDYWDTEFITGIMVHPCKNRSGFTVIITLVLWDNIYLQKISRFICFCFPAYLYNTKNMDYLVKRC